MTFWAQVIPAVIGYLGQRETNKDQIQLGQDQMSFQERMSGTAYQRAVQDMQAAGLNPMLAYSQGGASAPMGSMPTVQNPVAAGVNSAQAAIQMSQALAQVENIAADTDVKKATAKKIEGDTIDETGDNLVTNKMRQEIALLMQQLPKLQYETGQAHSALTIKRLEEILTADKIPQQRAEAEFYRGEIGSELPAPVRQLLLFFLQMMKGK